MGKSNKEGEEEEINNCIATLGSPSNSWMGTVNEQINWVNDSFKENIYPHIHGWYKHYKDPGIAARELEIRQLAETQRVSAQMHCR